MSKSLASVIDSLLAQGFNKPQVLEVLASEYWIDSTVTRYLSNI